jgi:two-component system, OmpR family, response regulator
LLRRAMLGRQGQTDAKAQDGALFAVGQTCRGDEKQVRFAGWLLDITQRQLTSPQGVVVALSSAEFRLLQVFLHRPGRVLSREQLLDEARGRNIEAFDRSIDLLVSRLRNKLGEDPKEPKLIRTLRGEGYIFTARLG